MICITLGGGLKQILHKVGIETDEDRIFVSCDYKKSKESGALWEYFSQKISNGNKILHIGDSKKADFIVPQDYGIDTYPVRSAYEMLMHSSLKEIVPEINSLAGSLAVGLIQAEICNSPFAFNEKKGIISFKNVKEAGYCLMGNFCYSFMNWLMKNAVADGVEEIVFLAREGYLLIEEYQYLCDLLKKEQLPNAVYLEISRRAIMNASIEKKEDIYETASFPYTGSLKEFLWDRFRVDTADEEAALVEATEIQKEKQTLESALDKYIDQIYEKTQEERKNYLRYLSGLELKSKAGVVDSMLYGNTQHYLEKLRKESMQGYYFCFSNECFCDQNMKGCFQTAEDITGKHCKAMRHSKFLQAFFTSPNGMLIHMDSDGKSVYSEKMSNQNTFEVRIKMQEGILEFIRNMLDLQDGIQWKEMCPDTIFADKLFGIFMDDGFEPGEEMKQSFYFDNGILNHNEAPIWE